MKSTWKAPSLLPTSGVYINIIEVDIDGIYSNKEASYCCTGPGLLGLDDDDSVGTSLNVLLDGLNQLRIGSERNADTVIGV